MACAMIDATPPPTECGDYPAPLSSTQPNVLFIGDSISMSVPYTPGGYGVNVREGLAARNINSWHSGGLESGGQASNTLKGLWCTNPAAPGNWLNFTGTYDVIHFNFGLHDLVDAGPDEGVEHVELEQYAANVVEIYNRLAARARKVMFATTTPCPNVTTYMGRTNSKVVAYNSAALSALFATVPHVLFTDDLYSEVVGYCGKDYLDCDLQKPENVHFETKGQQFLGDKVIKSVVAALSLPAQFETVIV